MNRYYVFFLIYPILMGVIIFEYKKELIYLVKIKILNEVSSKDLLIGVMSHRSNFLQRQTIRDTWWKNKQHYSDRVELKFVVGKHACLIHPEDRQNEYQCLHWDLSVPNITEDLALVTSFSDNESEYTYNYGVQRIQFKVLHDVIVTNLGVHYSSAVNRVRVSLQEAKSEREITSADFTTAAPGTQSGDFYYKNVTAYVLPKGFEGVLIGRRLDGTSDEMTTPTRRLITQIDDGGGVLQIQQYEPHIVEHYSSVKQWNRPQVTLVSFKYTIHEVDKLKEHVEGGAKRMRDWRDRSESEFEKLIKEEEDHGDLLFVDTVDIYRNIPQKLLHFCKWAIEENDLKMLLKTDDDTYLDVQGVLRASQLWSNMTRLWWGRFRHNWAVEHSGKWQELVYKAPMYPKFACGVGYVIGRDVVQWLAHNADSLHIYQGEDVSMGIWLSAIGPTYMDDPLWQCSRECISDMHATPDLPPADMKKLWYNKLRCDDPCGCY